MAFTTDRLVDQINLKGSLPTGRYSDADILDLAYDVMLSEIVPDVLTMREEYYVRSYDTSLVAAQANYPIVSRAIGGVLRELKYIVSPYIYDLPRVDVEEIGQVVSGTPDLFYIQGNDLYVFPTPSASTGSLRQHYFIRPSKFVTVAECGIITAINTSTKTVTLTIPSGWTTNSTFDLVKGTPHYDIIDFDLTATSVGSGAIIMTNTLPTTLAVGDYVTLAGETCFPFLPVEGHTALVQSTVAAALEAIGDPAATTAAQKAQALRQNFRAIMGVRVQGAPKLLNRRVL
jgi:hypothetical protein